VNGAEPLTTDRCAVRRLWIGPLRRRRGRHAPMSTWEIAYLDALTAHSDYALTDLRDWIVRDAWMRGR